MENTFNIQPDLFFGIFLGILIVIIVLLIIVWVQLNHARKSYRKMINGGRPENVEQLIIALQNNLQQLEKQNESHKNEIIQIKRESLKMKSHIAVNRYNAFAEGGSDLSFSIAFMDEEQDGVVLTGIHGREQTFVYAKPVEKGQSSYNLSPEEKLVIQQVAVKRNV